MRLDAAFVAARGPPPTRLNVAGSGLDGVGDLSVEGLVRVDAADNPGLASIDGLAAPQLKHLDVRRATIRTAAPSLANLRVLDLSSCSLTTFDASSLPRLAALMLADNPLKDVTGLGACPELATLVVKGCALTTAALQSLLAQTPALVKLSAGANGLTGALNVGACPLLSEVRVGRNVLTSVPAGLGPRLRLLDAGSNPGLGPLKDVVAALAGKPWLRAVTLRGTAAAAAPGYEAALRGAVPALRVLDDGRVDGKKGGDAVEAAGGERARRPAKAAKDAAPSKPAKPEPATTKAEPAPATRPPSAVGRLASAGGLGAPPPRRRPSDAERPLPLPPPLPAVKEAKAPAVAAVIEVAAKKRKTARRGVATGAAAAALLARAADDDGGDAWGGAGAGSEW